MESLVRDAIVQNKPGVLREVLQGKTHSLLARVYAGDITLDGTRWDYCSYLDVIVPGVVVRNMGILVVGLGPFLVFVALRVHEFTECALTRS